MNIDISNQGVLCALPTFEVFMTLSTRDKFEMIFDHTVLLQTWWFVGIIIIYSLLSPTAEYDPLFRYAICLEYQSGLGSTRDDIANFMQT